MPVNFKNDTDLRGLLHSHGVRMDNAFDGSQLQQKEMAPGESFAYKLKFLDAGIYWYHPHAKEVFEQPLGLYGAFIVTPSDPGYFPPVNREMPLFLSDLPIENGVIALGKEKSRNLLMGNYGNVMLTSGEEKFDLQAKKGEVIRLYVINAANARPFNFTIKGLKLKLVGGDSGAYERASFVESVLLNPSERAIADVFLPDVGTYEIQNKTPDRTYSLGTISARGESADVSYKKEWNTPQSNAATIKSIDPFRASFMKEPDKRIKLSVNLAGGMQNMMSGGSMMMEAESKDGSTALTTGGIEWEDTNQMMNAMSNTENTKWKIIDEDTSKENMGIDDWTFKKGEPVKIRIENNPNSAHPMQHPIHFHGQRFLVVARDGILQTNLVWKDTVFIPSGQYVDILLDVSNPGEWMAHCHIAEHLEAGMMMGFTVE
ncbi:MAG: multicopper oxidase family protein [Patescibacteria group bacterium]